MATIDLRETLGPLLFTLFAGCTTSPATKTQSLSADQAAPQSASETPLSARGIRRIESTNPEGAWQGAQISMRLKVRAGPEWMLADEGAQLRTGERFQVELNLESPRCVALLYQRPAAPPGLLYPLPGSGDRPCLPAGKTSLPELELDPNEGEEVLFLVTSTKPLGEIDPALHQKIENVRSGDQKNPLVETASPETASPIPNPSRRHERARSGRKRVEAAAPVDFRSRGIQRVRSDRSAVDARAGDDGVAILLFRFEHIGPG